MELQNHKKQIIILAVFLAILFLILVIIFNKKEKNEEVVMPEESQQEEEKIPLHQCNVDNFSKSLSKGEKTSFGIVLYPSAPDKNYRLKPSGFPPGVKGSMAEIAQNGKVAARIDIEITDKANSGSYTMAVVYEEENEEGEYISNNCKYNIVIN